MCSSRIFVWEYKSGMYIIPNFADIFLRPPRWNTVSQPSNSHIHQFQQFNQPHHTAVLLLRTLILRLSRPSSLQKKLILFSLWFFLSKFYIGFLNHLYYTSTFYLLWHLFILQIDLLKVIVYELYYIKYCKYG